MKWPLRGPTMFRRGYTSPLTFLFPGGSSSHRSLARAVYGRRSEGNGMRHVGKLLRCRPLEADQPEASASVEFHPELLPRRRVAEDS